jgi:hypothetical protein
LENSTRSRTPLFFQQALVEEIKIITKGMLFQAPNKKELIPMEAFPQSLPIPVYKNENESNESNNNITSLDYESSQYDDPVFKCPWSIVKLEEGNIAGIMNNKQYKSQSVLVYSMMMPVTRGILNC